MTFSAPQPVVRAPWPDELPRLGCAFPDFALERVLHLEVLAVPATSSTVERLVGFAMLVPPSGSHVEPRLVIDVRPRFSTTPAAAQLLARLLTFARENDLPRLVTLPRPESDPLGTQLRAAGFAPRPGEKLWTCDVG